MFGGKIWVCLLPQRELIGKEKNGRLTAAAKARIRIRGSPPLLHNVRCLILTGKIREVFRCLLLSVVDDARTLFPWSTKHSIGSTGCSWDPLAARKPRLRLWVRPVSCEGTHSRCFRSAGTT